MIDENKKIYNDLVIALKYAIESDSANMKLYLARLIRKYRMSNPELADLLEPLLKYGNDRARDVLRNKDNNMSIDIAKPSILSGPYEHGAVFEPVLSSVIEEQLKRFLLENRNEEKLLKSGIPAPHSLIFTGDPGMGKTLTAHWLAEQLDLPLYKVDLAMVVGSYLGQTGANIQKVFQYAKKHPMVLLLDELDAIAKKRDDSMDVGEMKRIVIVLLQELESWTGQGVIIAATNHPKIIDNALWRRFDYCCNFMSPNHSEILKSLKLFWGSDYPLFKDYDQIFALLNEGLSFADIEKKILSIRRRLIVDSEDSEKLLVDYIRANTTKEKRLKIADMLIKKTRLSQYRISEITGVSRDTLRKYKNKSEKREASL